MKQWVAIGFDGNLCVLTPLYPRDEVISSSFGYTVTLVVDEDPLAVAVDIGNVAAVVDWEFVKDRVEILGEL